MRYLFKVRGLGWGISLIAGVLLLLVIPARLHAQVETQDMAARVKALEDGLTAVEAEVQTLQASKANAIQDVLQSAQVNQPQATAPPQQLASQVTGETGQLPVYDGATSAGKAFNPDIGIIGNFVAVGARNAIKPLPSLSLQESELSMQAVVDPYARADFFLAFGEQGVEVEEGYVTFTALPKGVVAKVGKMRAGFGRVNSFHNHTLPWVDRSLATFNLLGGSLEEADIGIKDAGISVSRILPSPKGLFLEGTAEVFRGDSGSLFKSSQRSDVSVVGHLKAYHDFTESTNLEVGGSFARGHNDLGSACVTRLAGMDATFCWKSLRRAIYHSFTARSELFWSQREQITETQRAFGWYGSAEYQLGRRWFTGARYDWSERARNARQHDSGGSLVLTYWPSEFTQVRAQLRRTVYAEGKTSNELLGQVLFTIGAHGAHPF
jgi:competence protein ComGC